MVEARGVEALAQDGRLERGTADVEPVDDAEHTDGRHPPRLRRARTVAMGDALNAAATSGQRAEFRQVRPIVSADRLRSGVTSNAQSGGVARLRWPSVTHAPLGASGSPISVTSIRGYSRNRIVAKALTRAGADVRTVSDPRPYARRTPPLVRPRSATPTDLVLVGFPGHADVVAAKALARLWRAPVLFDAFVSLEEYGRGPRAAAGPGKSRRARARGPRGVPIRGPGAGRHRCSRRALRRRTSPHLGPSSAACGSAPTTT